jgi:membrane-associated phospholipid phosphatase
VPASPERGHFSRLLAWDVRCSARLAAIGQTRPWRWFALLLAHSGDSPLWLAGGVAGLLWGGPVGRAAGLRIVVATLAGGVTATLAKWVFRRGRPAPSSGGLYLSLDRHAFPSGHATRAGCVVVSLALLLPGWETGLLAAWAGLVSLARVALGAHYLLDVAAGLLLGVLIGAILATLL